MASIRTTVWLCYDLFSWYNSQLLRDTLMLLEFDSTFTDMKSRPVINFAVITYTYVYLCL